MKRRLVWTTVAALAACSSTPEPRVVQPGLPGEASRTTVPGEPAAATPHTPADVAFMQGMIAHHAQAIVLTDMVPSRTTSVDIRLLAQRIGISQVDEIALMRKWLRERGENVPDPAHHMHTEPMPGMLTQAQLDRLAGARGAAFDRLFLELMIQHHEGALTMLDVLYDAPRAAQEPEIFRIASEIDADQRGEIARMRALLNAR